MREDLIEELVGGGPLPGLILQLDENLRDFAKISFAHKALNVAMARRAEWPGVLLWTPTDDVVFLPLSTNLEAAQDQLRFLFRNEERGLLRYAQSEPSDLTPDRLAEQEKSYLAYALERGYQIASPDDLIAIIHLSDVHLGTKVAKKHMARIMAIVRNAISELQHISEIIPVVTGDIMNSSSEKLRSDFLQFDQFLNTVANHKPIYILGNHDVRTSGFFSRDYYAAKYIPIEPVISDSSLGIQFICFDSNEEGSFARGKITDNQFINLGNLLDSAPEKNLMRIALVHHHPMPVSRPEWYKRPFFEWVIGPFHDKTMSIVNGQGFLDWITQRKVRCVLHGHKHIPCSNKHGTIPIIGCGSTSGTVKTNLPISTYMSVNVITINRKTQKLYCSFRAETRLGAGLRVVTPQ